MKSNKGLWGVMAALFVGSAALQVGFVLPTWEKNYSSKQGVVTQDLSPDQIFLSLFGFREFLAGILWVKADTFFDQGNYDAVLPIIRLCTILDPKQIDIYATGMWHIGYNFTDAEQRSDRRYIPSALALGKEGARQNPQTYEMYFETGWMWYHKIDDDYGNAVKWFKEAGTKDDIPPARRDLLRNAYDRNGQIVDGINLLYNLYDEAQARSEENPIYNNTSIRDTIEKNTDTDLVRAVERGYVARHLDEASASGWNANIKNDPSSANWWKTGNYDTKPPFDVGFSVKVTVLDPRYLRFEGTWNVQPIGTRIRVIFRDRDYPGAKPGGMDWDASNTVSLDPPKNITFMQDQLFVRNRRFDHKVDMRSDPNMYPCVADKYVLEFYYNPRSAPPHIQDRFGWDGEGMTDKNFLNEQIRPGQRVMFATLELTKEQILRRGEWADKVPVVKTANYKEVGPAGTGSDSALIDIPSLRGGK